MRISKTRAESSSLKEDDSLFFGAPRCGNFSLSGNRDSRLPASPPSPGGRGAGHSLYRRLEIDPVGWRFVRPVRGRHHRL